MAGFLRRVLSEKNIFRLLVFFSFTQLAYHFWPNWSYVFGLRVDYLSVAVYFTDLLVLALFAVWISKYKPKKKFVFSFNSLSAAGANYALLFILFALLNIFFAFHKELALFKWLRVLEMFFVGYYIYRSKEFEIKSWFFVPLAYSVVLLSFVSVLQFIFQKTIGGPFIYLGERTFSSSTPGIALWDFRGRQFLRAYSTFPHPNSMAGYLGLVLILLVGYWKRLSSRKTLFSAAFLLGAVSLFLSVSLNAAFSLLIALSLFLLFRFSKNKPFRLVAYAPLVLIVVTFGLFLVWGWLFPNIGAGRAGYETSVTGRMGESLYRRAVLSTASLEIFSLSPVLGTGLNNFISRLPFTEVVPTVLWWLQPVHNVFLLVLSELGVVGLVVVFIVLQKTTLRLVKKKSVVFLAAVVFVLLTGMWDHYWLTLQQNQLILALVLGMSARDLRKGA